MKIRTFLLFVCMIVVPLLAMFSHKIPPEIRAACGDLILRPAIDLIEAAASATEPKPAAPPVTFEAPPAGPLLAGSPPTEAPGTDQPDSPLAENSSSSRAADPATALLTSSPPASSHQFPPARPAASLSLAAGRLDAGSLRQQLAAVGAHRLLLEPTADGSGQFHGSCRVAVDPSGELQRLFHAHASSEAEALQNLLEQVTRWQQRLAATPPGGQARGAVVR